MAAGRSSRFGRPKAVEPLGPEGESLMAYTVFDALRAGFGGVVVVTRPELRPALEAHLAEHLGAGLPVTWVHQDPEDVPDAHRDLAVGRSKPWGTAQAVLSARAHLPGAFGIANVDDWYGPEAHAALVQALRNLTSPPTTSEAMSARPLPDPPCPAVLVGFPMAATLPPGGGGVSRGWVRGTGNGVEGVLELRDVARAPSSPSPAPTGEEPGIRGILTDGGTIAVPDDAWASMNLWGVGRCALPLLWSAFDEFLSRQGGDPEAEFALSSAVDTLIRRGSLTLRLVPAGRRWFGITHPGDAPWVRERLEALHADGTYPRRLTRVRDEGPPKLAP